MTGTILVVILVAVAVILVAGGLYYASKRRTARLKDYFGSEYERAMRQSNDKGAAEKELRERQQRVESFQLKELAPDDQRHFAGEWRLLQARFVDDPGGTIAEADTLIVELMEARGYPMTDFENRAADISVGHAAVVPHYRAAHAMAERHKKDRLSTEELRQALVHFRTLFDELLGAAPRVQL